MKTESIINIRNSFILLIGVTYCAVGGLFLAEVDFSLRWLPLALLYVSPVILGATIGQSKGAWDEYTKAQFFKLASLAYGLTSISLAILFGFSDENGMVTVSQVSGIMMLGFGIPAILFALDGFGEK